MDKKIPVGRVTLNKYIIFFGLICFTFLYFVRLLLFIGHPTLVGRPMVLAVLVSQLVHALLQYSKPWLVRQFVSLLVTLLVPQDIQETSSKFDCVIFLPSSTFSIYFSICFFFSYPHLFHLSGELEILVYIDTRTLKPPWFKFSAYYPNESQCKCWCF